MIELRQTQLFAAWVKNLKDRIAGKKIAQRLARLEAGLWGDAKPVGDNIWELRIDHGPGYRLYLVQRDDIVIILLCGGDKSTQTRDIAKAKTLAKDL